jgi:hypothetical protein
MAKVTPISEHSQHFLTDLKETFWRDVYGQTRIAWQRFFPAGIGAAAGSLRRLGWYERGDENAGSIATATTSAMS